MVVLDTDHMTFLEWMGSAQATRLEGRLRALPDTEKATTIISYEEQTKGWLGYMSQQKSTKGFREAYRKLLRHVNVYCSIRVLDFNERAATKYEQLRKAHRRLGTLDLRIAAIALTQTATLLTRDVGHFGEIPGLVIEDWTV